MGSFNPFADEPTNPPKAATPAPWAAAPKPAGAAEPKPPPPAEPKPPGDGIFSGPPPADYRRMPPPKDPSPAGEAPGPSMRAVAPAVPTAAPTDVPEAEWVPDHRGTHMIRPPPRAVGTDRRAHV